MTVIETVGWASSDGSTNRPARRAAAAARLTTVPLVWPASLAFWAAPGSWWKKLSVAALAVTGPAPGAGTACQTRIDVFAFHRGSDVLTVVHGRQLPSSPSR